MFDVYLSRSNNNVMSNFLNDLRKYLESLSKDEFLEAWEKTSEYADVGINVEDFLSCNGYCYSSYKDNENTSNTISPELSSGFFN